MVRLRALSVAALALCATLPFAQLTSTGPQPIVGARSLALSPDGKRLAFVYRGDIWVAPSSGGKAAPVTNHIEMEDSPVWSPDGKWIAYASNRYGGNSIMAVPADGGQTQRLTWFGGSESPSDWSPDGSKILFRSSRDDAYNGVFELDVRTLRFQSLFTDMMTVRDPKYAADGKSILYNRFGFPWTRPRYEGSAAAQVWRFDPATGSRAKVRSNGFQHLWLNAGFDSGTALCVTVGEKTPSSSFVGKPIPKNVDSVARTPNVVQLDSRGNARRLTDFVGGGVRFLTVAPKANLLAFEYEGSVYSMAFGVKPQKVEIVAVQDEKFTNEERLILTSGVDEFTLSPKNDEVVFAVRSELWKVPVKKGEGPNANDATQLTDWPGLDEAPIYTPDGSAIFFVSDREGTRNLYRMTLADKKIQRITAGDNDVFALGMHPDKKSLTFWVTGRQGGAYTVPADGSGAPQLALAMPGSGPREFAFSPDGRWIAYVDRLNESGYYYWESGSNVWVYDTTSKRGYNVTQENSGNYSPAWSSDGKYLYFNSNRAGSSAVYLVPLQKEQAREEDLTLKFEKPEGAVKVEIDFDDIQNRVRTFVSQSLQGPLVSEPEKGEVYFLSGGDVWKSGYDGQGARRITSGGGILSWGFSEDYSNIFFVKDGGMHLVDVKKPNFPQTSVAFRSDWTRDLRLERRAAFDQFWREYNRSFYDGNFHGRDWVATKKRYEPLLESVRHRNEMATLLNMLVGELEASHTEAGAAPGNPGGESSAHPGFSIDYSWIGAGLKVKEVPEGAPGSFEQTRIRPGEFVLQINGVDVRADEALFRDVLNGQTGRDLTLLVNSVPDKTGARTVKYRALSGGAYSGIVRRNLLEWRRKYVEEKSGGKLTYVHIAGMGGGNFDQFQREFWQVVSGKQGVVIDVRNNGGGNISDRLIDIIERKPHSYYVPRDEDPLLSPGQTWAKPTVVMHAETSFSNAEMFPYAMRQRGLATLVGMPTPGYVIWTGGFRLVDGTSARMPGSGVYRIDGSPLENMGQQPDQKVDILPEEFFAGKDPQLDRAIETLLRQVGK